MQLLPDMNIPSLYPWNNWVNGFFPQDISHVKRIQAEKILKWKTLDKIKTYPHESLNASRIVIRSLNLTLKKKTDRT